ncbi:MAG: fatty acyl-AMP ligase [Alphaproteobacteria bacterium]|nr:fatty acyl-AMP ligase [Alphaproteobacteria bacterium]
MQATATTNNSLPIKIATFQTFTEALDYAAKGSTGMNFYSAKGELTYVLTYQALQDKAMQVARGLIKSGIPKGSRMVLVADTDPNFMILFAACQYASIIPVPVAIPTVFGAHKSYVDGLKRQLMGSLATAAAAPISLLPFLKEAALNLDIKFLGSFDHFLDLPYADTDIRPFDPDETCYLQYSSGSTRFPLGIDIHQRSLMANAYAIANHGLCIRDGDRTTSWLPLYHDMGLVGFMLVPLLCQISIDYLTTRDFARRPLLWLSLISRHQSTISYSPSFGYDLCVRRARDLNMKDINLSSWRAAGIGGDMIQAQILEKFVNTFAPYGFKSKAFVPSYGMAETTLAISFAPLDKGFQSINIDREKLSQDNIADIHQKPTSQTRDFVLCGNVLPKHSIEVRNENGQKLGDQELGKIFVKGPSLMNGYFNQPEITKQILSADGWLDTGDLGFLYDNQIIITGRSKDLIIINGRNIWPQDLEWAIEELPNLRRGDVAAFSIEKENDNEEIIILLQCRLGDEEAKIKLIQDAESCVRQTTGLDAKIVLVPPHSLPQTSSGKLSRSKAKNNYLMGTYIPLKESSYA